MQLKCESIKWVLLMCVTLTSAAVAPRYRHFCPQCEEEVWEEVPCDQISKSTTTTTTTTATPIQVIVRTPSTPKPYATHEAPIAYSHNISDAAAPYMPTTTPSTYNRCYCECKVGCKEFCRKVTVDGASDKQITQITKTSNRAPYGNVETEHVHRHIFVPDIEPAPYNPVIPAAPAVTPNAHTHQAHPVEASNEHAQYYEQPNLAYEVQPAPPPPLPAPITPQLAQPLPPQLPSPHSQVHAYPLSYPQYSPVFYENSKGTYTYPDILMDASYSVDELTRLLQIESVNKDAPITYSQPTLYTPANSAAYSRLPTAQASRSQAPALPQTYNPPSPPSSPPASPPASAASSAEQKYGSSLSISHYEAANLGHPSAAQYGNYIHKHYESAPSSGESNDYQNSPSLGQHTAYDNQRRDCGSSDSAGKYPANSASQSSTHKMSY